MSPTMSPTKSRLTLHDEVLSDHVLDTVLGKFRARAGRTKPQEDDSQIQSSKTYRHFTELCQRGETLVSSLFLRGVKRDDDDEPFILNPTIDCFRASYKGKRVIVNVLRPAGLFSDSSIAREVILCRQLSHPNIQPFLGIVDGAAYNWTSLGIVTLALENILEKMKALDEQHQPIPMMNWINGISAGLAYLHQEGHFHGDVRAKNILVGPDLRIQITSPGFAHLRSKNPWDQRSFRWFAPEPYQERATDYTTEHDVYSFGCTCVELYTRRKPFYTIKSNYQVFHALERGERPSRPNVEEGHLEMPDELWRLVQRCWGQNPEERPTISEVVKELGRLEKKSR